MKGRIFSGIMPMLLLMSMTASSFDIQPVRAEGILPTIHLGSGVAKESEYFSFGMGDIFWSISHEERGYFYGSSYSTPEVFFADRIENYWGSYDSYQGVRYIWEFTNASNHKWFTQHSITFAEETSPGYTGILLIQQGNLYGAIKPKSIHNGDLNHPEEFVLEYDWWYDDSGGSDFSSLKLFGDVNNDSKVDIRDIARAGLAFGSHPDHPRWNPQADLNQDGKVDIKDIATIAKNFGKTLTP